MKNEKYTPPEKYKSPGISTIEYDEDYWIPVRPIYNRNVRIKKISKIFGLNKRNESI